MSIVLKFKSVSLKNFLSFGNFEQTFYLDTGSTTSITGENLDIGGSNGSGKTTIINAICYALYNKAFDNITLQRLINSTNQIRSTQMEVRIQFMKGDVQYEIFRSRGSEYSVQILRDQVDITPGKGAAECDQAILEIIELSYDLFVKAVIFSGNSPAFLQLPLFQQRSHIEELFNISTLSEKATILKERIRQTELDIGIQEAICKQQQISMDLHQKQIKDAESRSKKFCTDRDTQISDLREELRLVSSVNFENESKYLGTVIRTKGELRELERRITSIKSEVQALTKSIQKKESEFQHLTNAKCPYCAQLFENADQKALEVQAEIEASAESLSRANSELVQAQHQKHLVTAEFQEAQAQCSFETEAEFREAQSAAGLYDHKIQVLLSSENPYVQILERLNETTEIKVDTAELDDLKRTLQHQQFLLKLLVDKSSFLRKHIITRLIPFLNDRLNFYTRELGLPHVVKFDADMSCTVSEYGRELDFGNLSAGEKKRVNTAMALAFRDVLHRTKLRTNLLIIDELDGQLDVPGIDAIIRTLKDISRDENASIFVISHHPSVHGRLDNNLTIRKEGGFSSIVSE